VATLRIEMLNNALMRIGANPLQSEQDASAPQHLAVFDGVARDLASKPFSVFKSTRRLVRDLIPTGSPTHYLYAYKLPPDRCGPPRAIYPNAEARRPTTDYDIEGDLIYTTHEQIWCTVTTLRDLAKWSGDLQEAFITCLMAELALSVREDRPLHDRLWQKARGTPTQNGLGGLVGAALENDNQAQPSTQVGGGVNPLIDVRG
jgi:hypothetical protein